MIDLAAIAAGALASALFLLAHALLGDWRKMAKFYRVCWLQWERHNLSIAERRDLRTLGRWVGRVAYVWLMLVAWAVTG